MTDRTKALGSLALFFAASFGVAWLLSPWADVIALVLIIAIAPPATAFAVLYALTAPWWTTLIGRAMLISSTGLALLVDISLIYKWLGDDYLLRDAVKVTVFWAVFVGASYKAVAFGVGKFQEWKARRARANRLPGV